MDMARRDFLVGAGSLALTAAVHSQAQRPGGVAARAPNIVLIESDDHLWDALGCMGNAAIKTPHLDRLAERGVLFRNHVCQGAECVPSRHSLLTGSYPHNNGVYSNRCQALDDRQWTLPGAMQRSGYRTALIGKNHFRSRPNDQVKDPKDFADPGLIAGWQSYGFDDVLAVNGKVAAGLGWGEGPFRAYLRGKGLLDAHEADYKTRRYQGRRAITTYVGASPLSEEDCHDAFIRRLFTDWLSACQDDRPFFAWVDFVAPHLPCDAPEPYASMHAPASVPPPVPAMAEDWPQRLLRRSRKRSMTAAEMQTCRAGYYGMVSLLDTQVGKMVAALEAEGCLDNTVVAFVGDQGCAMGDHGLWGKGTLLKSSINSPMVIACPSRFRQRVVVDRPVEMQDLAPTFLDLAGAAPKETHSCYGQSLLPLLTGEGTYARDAAFAEKLNTKMVTTAEHKYIFNSDDEVQLLFDLAHDPDETQNLAGRSDYADIERDLQTRLLRWLADTYAHPNSFRPVVPRRG